MNAPKEYYPVGYDKNFDDNFVTKVDLPQTTFHCGDQKHFPGLYADEDLGCMVSRRIGLAKWTEDQIVPLNLISGLPRVRLDGRWSDHEVVPVSREHTLRPDHSQVQLVVLRGVQAQQRTVRQ